MIDLLLQIFIAGIAIAGIKIAFQEGMVFHAIAKGLKWLPAFFTKPLFGCIYCMASIWGSVFYVIFSDPSFFDLIYWGRYMIYIPSVSISGALCYFLIIKLELWTDSK